MRSDRTGTPSTPIRTCVGCRRRDSRSALLRVVIRTGPDGVAVVPDPGHRAAGRGASLHPTLACFEQAVRRRAFGRALRVTVALDTEPVRMHLEGQPQTEPSE